MLNVCVIDTLLRISQLLQLAGERDRQVLRAWVATAAGLIVRERYEMMSGAGGGIVAACYCLGGAAAVVRANMRTELAAKADTIGNI